LHAWLVDWRRRQDQTALVVLHENADMTDGLDAMCAGARAVLPRTAGAGDIVTAVKAVVGGHVVLPPQLMSRLLAAGSLGDRLPKNEDFARAPLTPREREILSAMANGDSNKAIARRLGISFHTVKFHVAAVLEKLDADSRTEAVTKAAQLGLVML
jgi:DNA-binding NarL/FixJ family response regulator